MSRPLPPRSASAPQGQSPGMIPPPEPAPLELLERHILSTQPPIVPEELLKPLRHDDDRGVYTFPEGLTAPPVDFFRFGPRG